MKRGAWIRLGLAAALAAWALRHELARPGQPTLDLATATGRVRALGLLEAHLGPVRIEKEIAKELYAHKGQRVWREDRPVEHARWLVVVRQKREKDRPVFVKIISSDDPDALRKEHEMLVAMGAARLPVPRVYDFSALDARTRSLAMEVSEGVTYNSLTAYFLPRGLFL